MKKNIRPFILQLCYLLLLMPVGALAQKEPPHDTAYYGTYLDKITTRIFFSKKYTSMDFPAVSNNSSFTYKPNTQLTLGLGATYRTLSLNLSTGFGFLNSDDEKGKTKSIDLEIHVYPYGWMIDLLGIRHKGLFIDPKGYAALDNESYYYRPDATMILAGIGAYRVANKERLSLNAAMIQSEWQKKSAGSLLYGGEIYYSSLKADSSLVPAAKQADFAQALMDKMQFFTIGAGAGYVYTLVLGKRFYATGSAIANLDVHFVKENIGATEEKRTAINPSFIYKAAIGYNQDSWNISANWAANTLYVRSPLADDAYVIPTGNYRLIFAKRFDWKKKNKR